MPLEHIVPESRWEDWLHIDAQEFECAFSRRCSKSFLQNEPGSFEANRFCHYARNDALLALGNEPVDDGFSVWNFSEPKCLLGGRDVSQEPRCGSHASRFRR